MGSGEESNADRWVAFLEATSNEPLAPIYSELDPYLPEGGTAIDLGCGAGRATRWLVDRGFRVTAVDSSEQAIEFTRRKLPKGADVELVHSSFEDLQLHKYDVAIAHFSLFFLGPDEFRVFWHRLVDSINSEGLFMGQFLGVNDAWRGETTTQNRAEVDRLLEAFDVLKLVEEENDGPLATGGTKHWHVFHVIARKR